LELVSLFFQKVEHEVCQLFIDHVRMKKTPINKTCPISGRPVAADSLTTYRGVVVGFCNSGCRDAFETPRIAFDRLIEKKTP